MNEASDSREVLARCASLGGYFSTGGHREIDLLISNAPDVFPPTQCLQVKTSDRVLLCTQIPGFRGSQRVMGWLEVAS